MERGEFEAEGTEPHLAVGALRHHSSGTLQLLESAWRIQRAVLKRVTDDLKDAIKRPGVPVGEMVIEPERTARVIRQVGDDVIGADFHQTFLDGIGLDPQDSFIDVQCIAKQRRADNSIKIRSGDNSHSCRSPWIAVDR